MSITGCRIAAGLVPALLLGWAGLFTTAQAQDSKSVASANTLPPAAPSAVRSVRALLMHSAVVHRQALAAPPKQTKTVSPRTLVATPKPAHIKISRPVMVATHSKPGSPMPPIAVPVPSQTHLSYPSGSMVATVPTVSSSSPAAATASGASSILRSPFASSVSAPVVTGLPLRIDPSGAAAAGPAPASSVTPAFSPHVPGMAPPNSRPMGMASPIVAQAQPGQAIVLPSHWYDTTPGRIGIFVGASLLASAFDRPVQHWATRHQNNTFYHTVVQARTVLPWPAFYLVLLNSFPSPWANAKLAHTSSVAFTAAILTSAEVLTLKGLVGRDRPNFTNNPYSGQPFNPRYSLFYGGSSFPSEHVSMSWALITPYARAYHMPWLYAFGVVSAMGRVMRNKHWFSDVVGGSLLGYYTAVWTEEHFSKNGNLGMIFTGNGFMLFKRF